MIGSFKTLDGHLNAAVQRTNALALAKGLDGTQPTGEQRAALTQLWAVTMEAAGAMTLAFSTLVQQAARFLDTPEARSFAETAEQMRKDIAVADKAARLNREREIDAALSGKASS